MVPIIQGVIRRVDEIARHEGQLLIADNFRYKWYPGAGIYEDGDVYKL